MHSAQPLEILADELGAAAGRIERELRLKDEARAARFEARLAAIELAALKAEEERQRIFAERLAQLRDGKDGEPGRDGKDADVEPIKMEIADRLASLGLAFADLEERVQEAVTAKLAEVKDGVQGQPGCDGKDADIEPLKSEVGDFLNKAREELSLEVEVHRDALEEAITKVEAKLAEVKDGKDGEPGKDADISGVMAEFKKHEAFILGCTEHLQSQIWEKLSEVKDGKDGQPGPEGPSGKDGKLPIVREWTNRVHYEGDVVRHGGATYQALADTGSEPPSGDWGELASRGTDGRGFVLRGTYDASAEYRQHDIVMINRNSFAAKYDSPGECPGDGWQLFGPSGQRGKEGPPGAKGMDGRSVSLANLEADPDAMVLRITDSLGKTFELDIHPIAERIVEAAR